jgi:hypothetical protein
VAVAGSGTAIAAKACTCTHILSSGHCTEYDCTEVLESVGTFKPVRKASDCRRSQVLLCDDNSCKLVCRPQSKK